MKLMMHQFLRGSVHFVIIHQHYIFQASILSPLHQLMWKMRKSGRKGAEERKRVEKTTAMAFVPEQIPVPACHTCVKEKQRMEVRKKTGKLRRESRSCGLLSCWDRFLLSAPFSLGAPLPCGSCLVFGTVLCSTFSGEHLQID